MDKTDEKRLKTEVPKYGDNVGIRATLNNMGFSNDSIGYDESNGTVTLNGKTLIKPSYLDDNAGVSYASESDIQQSLVNYYKDSSNPIVRVSDAYSAASGELGISADALSYGNGTVMIGGTPLNTLYIDSSGKAWAFQDDVNNLTYNYANSVGVESPNSILDRYDKTYLSDIRNRLDSLSNREEFSYDPDSDPVYLAYKNKYLLEGNRASTDTMANLSSLTGGYSNSAAVTAGALANQYYAQQLTDKIPELAELAYKRYYDSYQTDIDVLDRMISAYNSAYQNAVDANNQTRDNVNSTAKSNVDRDADAFEQYWEEKQNLQDYETQEMNNRWTEILNQQKQMENNYKMQGYALDNEQQAIFLEYYRRLLDSELEGNNLENEKTRAQIYSLYN